jgi:hypothetical protein
VNATGESIEQGIKLKMQKISEYELEELREHIDHISFNIEKVYRHAKDRSRKEFNQARLANSRRLYHSQKSEN